MQFPAAKLHTSTVETSPTDVNEFQAYKDEIIHLQLRDDAHPKQFPPRRVPLALQDQTHFELMEMQREGIIEPVTEPTEWCHPMLVTPKPNGRLRVCMDPRYLNEYLVRAVHPFPDIEQVFSSIRGARIFSKIDLTHGFWNLRLDAVSSNLCVFASPWGRFRYKRLPFGVSPAPEVFHRVVADVIKGLPNVIHYIDDILIFAATRAEHDAIVQEIIRRLKKVGFAICREKCSFAKDTVTFLGHQITGDKILPDPAKLEALRYMQPPANSAELHSFVGFINYLARFVPQLAERAEPLRRLLTSKVHFEWTEEQDRAFHEIRQMLLSSPGLAPFDPTIPLVVATDASQHGLGGVLLQNDRPVLYVARSLTPAESRYAIIEKELLAVVFVLTRCHFYTFGRPLVVRTDHKPLLGLVNSDVEKLSLRLRRLLEKLFPYSLRWEYVPGKDNHFPDALSRIGFKVPLTTSEVVEQDYSSTTDQVLFEQLQNGGPLFTAIHDAATHDAQFQALLKCASHGWPPKLVKRDARRYLLQPYWAIRHELRVVGSYILWGDRVCVPRTLQSRALTLLHQGHPGANFMQQRARNIFYWPGITADILRHVSQCEACAACRPLPPREPLLQEPPATYPGESVAADFFDLGSETYLVACDLFSNFPFYVKVASPSAAALVAAARTIFLQTGFPRTFLSDGGPAFRSDVFQTFLQLGACRHRVSSPRYAQSNGAAERVVQTIKTLKKKASTADELFLAVLHLQNTPRPDTGVSPAQLFFGRSQRSPVLPTARQFSSPWPMHNAALQRRQQQYALQYNRHAHARSSLDFHPGQRAYLRDPAVPAQIVQILGPAAQPRAYTVRLPSGVTTVRNQRFLFPFSRPGTSSPALTHGTATVFSSGPPASSVTLQPRPLSHLDPGNRLTSSSMPAACSSPSRLCNSTPAALTTRTPSPRWPAPVHPTGPVPAPVPMRQTTSTSSSGRDCSLLSWSPRGHPSTAVSGNSPSRHSAAVPAPANVLGTSRGGRLVFASLRAQEAAASGQSRPQIILRPPNQESTACREATGSSLAATPPAPAHPPSPPRVPPGPTTPASPSRPATPPASPTTAVTTPPTTVPVSLCATTSAFVRAASRTTATTPWSWTMNGLRRTTRPYLPSTCRTTTRTTKPSLLDATTPDHRSRVFSVHTPSLRARSYFR